MPQKLPTSPRYRKSAKALFLREKSIRSKNPSLISVSAAISVSTRKTSEYARQLREKQKVRRLYGISENQFKRYYDKASRSEDTAEQILLILERRLDNVIYRAGFATTRAGARQYASHALFKVNGARVNIPSLNTSIGDVICAIKPDMFSERPFDAIPDWLKLDKKKLEVSVVQLPRRSDADPDINEQLIVEYYSR